MIRSISAVFCIVYPLLVIAANSPLFPEPLQGLNQAGRHGLIILLAIVTIANSNYSILRGPRWSIFLMATTAASASFVVWLVKLQFGASAPISVLYTAIEPVFVVSCALTMQMNFIKWGHHWLLLMSLVVVFGAFVAMHYMAGLPMETGVYGRPRLTLGFSHPGKMAQVALLVFLVIVICSSRIRFAGAAILAVSAAIVGLSGSRSLLVAMAIIMTFAIAERVKQRTATFTFVAFAAAAATYFVLVELSDSSRAFLMSGRLAWWAQSINNNLREYGQAIWLYGASGTPIGNDALDSRYVDIVVTSFRIDSGYLEVVFYHGIPIVLIYLAIILRIALASHRRNLKPAALMVTLLFFQIGESGFLAVGNFFGLTVLALAFYSSIAEQANQKSIAI